MKIYLVTTSVDPFYHGETPILLFQNYPTRAEVAAELEKEDWFESNRDGWIPEKEGDVYSMDTAWEWNYHVQVHSELIQNEGKK